MRVRVRGDVDLEALLQRPLFAHLATASPNGPRHSPVWFAWEDGALWIIADRAHDTFADRIEAEPRCAIGIVDFDVATGRVVHASFRGRARIEPADQLRRVRLLMRYLGSDASAWDARFRREPEEHEVFVRFDPADVLVRDQSFRTG